jgi:hypothetical protein
MCEASECGEGEGLLEGEAGRTNHILIKAIQTKDIPNSIIGIALPEDLGPGLDDDHDRPVLACSQGSGLFDLVVEDLDHLVQHVFAVVVAAREEDVAGDC